MNAADNKVFKLNVGRIVMHRNRTITVLQNHLNLAMGRLQFEQMVLDAVPAEFKVVLFNTGVDSHGTPENGFVRFGTSMKLDDATKAPALRKFFTSLMRG